MQLTNYPWFPAAWESSSTIWHSLLSWGYFYFNLYSTFGPLHFPLSNVAKTWLAVEDKLRFAEVYEILTTLKEIRE